MRKDEKLTSIDEIDKIAYDILKGSKSFGKLPTPIEEIVKYTELEVNSDKYLNQIPKNYLRRSTDKLKKALGKIWGLLDRRKKVIYVDSDLIDRKKDFVTLHEVGHEVLPWQRKLFDLFEDDRISLDKDTKDEFESEANHFASSAIFQLEFFIEKVEELPLKISSAKYLADIFGASYHATFRQYVEHNKKRCALLVLKRRRNNKARLVNYFESIPFSNEFGILGWPTVFNEHFPFVNDINSGVNMLDDGSFLYTTPTGKLVNFEYGFFNNSYNSFVFLKPEGEEIKTRTKVILN